MPTINFAGIASGIDSNALIDAISQSTRQTRIVPSETKVSELEETNSAFTELKEKLENLQELGLKFATAGGGALSKLATSADETKLTASASNSANNGTYTVNVISKAKNHTLSYDDRYSSTSATILTTPPGGFDSDPEVDRTISFTIGEAPDNKTIDVVITSTMTVAGFVSAFNEAVTSTAPGYATAQAVNVGTTASPSYAVVINTNNEGTGKGLISAPVVGASITAAGNFLTYSENAATNSEIEVSGIAGSIIRSGNVISDVIAGVSLNLQGLGSTSVTVSDDKSKTQATIQEFVDAYNDIVQFINENNQIVREEDGEDTNNIFSPLAKSRTDDNFLIGMRNAISLARNQSATPGGNINIAVNTMADLGIKTERDGTLSFVIDDPTLSSFTSAMNADPTLVNEILMRFGDIISTTVGRPELLPGGGLIHQYVRFNGLIDISVNGNKSQITNLNDRIQQAEAFILQQEDNLRQRFARLESLTGRLQGQQQALTSALAGLGGG